MKCTCSEYYNPGMDLDVLAAMKRVNGVNMIGVSFQRLHVTEVEEAAGRSGQRTDKAGGSRVGLALARTNLADAFLTIFVVAHGHAQPFGL